ncbi:hypothetical protein F4678DRAFT_457829 [Xylaria arbuscula]|nr:hypothetical protein F4678DRAFT_457829 [Xylaria arbuscula]
MDSASSLPMSPWADRFRYPELTIIEGGMKHSLLAPRHPAFKDPKYYDQDPDPKAAHPPSNNNDIDRLQWSEASQQAHLEGARTYELIVLNRRLMFPTAAGLRAIPGGHRRTSRLSQLFSSLHLSRPLRIRKLSGSRKASGQGKVSGLRKSYGSLAGSPRPDFWMYEQGRIKVDQNTWLPFLRKDRWFDWINFSLVDRTRPTVTWSVDDEELWSGLSVVIELLRTMIYGRWDYWDNLEDVFGSPPYEDATVLLSYEKEQVVCNKRGTNVCEFKQTVDKTVPEARDRLIQLLSKLIWGFADTHGNCAFTSDQPSVGSGDKPYSSIICISVSLVQAMLNPDLTVDELLVKDNKD